MSEKPNDCYLMNPKLIVAPQDKGSPPSWVPAWNNERVVWVDRELFDKLLKLREHKPCDICPKDVKDICHKEDAEYRDLVDMIEKHRRK